MLDGVAQIYRTTLSPGKLELLEAWLPAQPWYRGDGAPSLAKAGGFRLDDPAGTVGIELMIVTDTASPGVDAYLVPLTYRDAPLAGGRLVGTATHGVLGRRYVYDAVSDPVFQAQALALVKGDAVPQAQSVSDTADPTVQVAANGAAGFEVVRELVDGSAGVVSAPWTRPDGSSARGAVLRAG